MNKYKYKKNAFIFVDPPYLFSDNSGYVAQSEDNDMTDIIVYLLD
jgi:site-specific DNA-adenine methylase